MARRQGKRPVQREPESESEEEVTPQLVLKRNRPLAMMPFLSGRNPNAKSGPAVASSGEALRVMPQSSAPPSGSAETSTSGRREPSASRPLTPEEREWTDFHENEGLMNARPYSWWLENDGRYCFAKQLEVFHGIKEEDGYWC